MDISSANAKTGRPHFNKRLLPIAPRITARGVPTVPKSLAEFGIFIRAAITTVEGNKIVIRRVKGDII
jgi:hypothetical protein